MKLSSRALLALAKRLPRGYWRVVRFAARRDPALWDLRLPLRHPRGETLRADLREPVFTPFLRHGCFPHQSGEDLLCMALLRAGDRVFDVGANIGFPTLLFAHLVGPGGSVVALEPTPRAFTLLQRTVGDRLNVTCLNVAASDHAGELSLYETPSLDTSSLEPVAGVTPYRVRTTTLDGLAARFGTPAFVKIDVEGHESAVLRGMTQLLQESAPPILLFEALTPSALRANIAELERGASERYSIHRCGPDGAALPVSAPEGTNNYLALPAWARARIDGSEP